ncbi:MAG TPA: nickel-dependent hydrogenase large subunit [Anaeromyxobacter sp.]
MGKLITIDPVTRIEGHLRIDVEVEGGAVKNAWSSGTMWRGIETILQGRDPRDAWVFTQRICGVCTTVHAIASVRSVENALGLEIPLNAQLIRNIVIGAHSLHDHVVHFYHLSALDWVDVTKVLEASPEKAAAFADSLGLTWAGNSKHALAAVKEKVKEFVAKGQLGIFTNGYWGHPAMKLSPEVNLLAVAHYLQALDVQRKANQAVAILGSKTPNIQNLAVGGVANAINLDSPSALNMEKLYQVKTLLDEVQAFVTQVYLPDVAAIAASYPDWLKYGAGVTNYLAVPDMPTDAKMTKFDLPGGVIWNGDLAKVRPITSWNDDYLRQNVTESIARSYYEGDEKRGPWEGQTVPKYTGEWKAETPAPERYSWVKAPRLEGKPVQVGPLAQLLAGYAQGHEGFKKWGDWMLGTAGKIAGVKLGPAVLHSTLGRHAARAIRCAVMSELAQKHWKLLVENVGKGDTAIFTDPMKTLKPGKYRGVGFHEAPRGTLSHWSVIESDGKTMKLENYQAVVPSTWNAGPRDAKDQKGPYEASLVGNPIAKPELPLEALRTIHSFDPCLACAIHTVDADGEEIARVKVL